MTDEERSVPPPPPLPPLLWVADWAERNGLTPGARTEEREREFELDPPELSRAFEGDESLWIPAAGTFPMEVECVIREVDCDILEEEPQRSKSGSESEKSGEGGRTWSAWASSSSRGASPGLDFPLRSLQWLLARR